MKVIGTLLEYLSDELAKDNPSMGVIIMSEVYLILSNQGSSRQEFLDACIDCEKAKAAFIERIIKTSELSETIVKTAFNTIISTPGICDLFKNCIRDLRASITR